jgi:hypothetical protein
MHSAAHAHAAAAAEVCTAAAHGMWGSAPATSAAPAAASSRRGIGGASQSGRQNDNAADFQL